jgi:hypothetical protein
MSISIYKPTSKNTGSGFSFQMGIDSKSKDPTLFIKSILQHSWDSTKKQGYFKDNLDNPDKNITVKFSEFEIGHIIHAMRTRSTYTTFHAYGEDKTSIKFMPWQKKSKKSAKNEKTGKWEDKWGEVDAFSVSFVRNGSQSFVIGLEPGETEEVMEYLRFVLQNIFKSRFEKQQADFEKSKNKKTDDGPAPF